MRNSFQVSVSFNFTLSTQLNNLLRINQDPKLIYWGSRFWDLSPFNVLCCRPYRKWFRRWTPKLLPTFILKREAACLSESLATTHQTTRRHKSDDRGLSFRALRISTRVKRLVVRRFAMQYCRISARCTQAFYRYKDVAKNRPQCTRYVTDSINAQFYYNYRYHRSLLQCCTYYNL